MHVPNLTPGFAVTLSISFMHQCTLRVLSLPWVQCCIPISLALHGCLFRVRCSIYISFKSLPCTSLKVFLDQAPPYRMLGTTTSFQIDPVVYFLIRLFFLTI
jgi:hypothetical protein